MGDIIIIHAVDACDFACRAASQLAAEGHSVRRLEAGRPPLDDDAADATVVVWSAGLSVVEEFGEALRRALARRILVPISIGAVEPPPVYAHLWPIDLTGWRGDADDPRWQFVRDEIALARIRKETPAASAPPKSKPTVRKPSAEVTAGPRRVAVVTRMIPAAAAGLAVLSATAVLMATPQQLRSRDEPIEGPTAMTAGSTLTLQAKTMAITANVDTASAPPQETDADFSPASPTGDAAAPDEPPEIAAQLREEKLTPAATTAPPGAILAEVETVVDLAIDSGLEEGGLVAPEEITAPNRASETEQTDEAMVAAFAEALQPLPLPPQAADDFVGVVFRDCLDCPDMAEIPAGVFQMGARPEDEDGASEAETPLRTVAIAKPFALSRREITFKEWDLCVDEGGCRAYRPTDSGWGRGARPVINVSWDDAQDYVTWLAAKTGHVYRLPSEAEWEYAARASRDVVLVSEGVISPMLANFEDGARGATAPTASFAPSAFGLYDMLGNVWEWVADCWRDSHAGAPADGSATVGECDTRVLKGGAFNSSAWRLRPAHRIAKNRRARESDNGFRVARDLP